MDIQFAEANSKHQKDILIWLEEPHVKEFWDNSKEHKEDIINFINGRNEASNYYDGLYTYWIALIDGQAYSLLMTIKEDAGMDRDQIKNDYLSKIGNTYSLDYMIGNKNYYGKGLGAKTLSNFIDFFRKEIDLSSSSFFIDPDSNNQKALHVYKKAGFEYKGNFIMNSGVFAGLKTDFLVKTIEPKIEIIPTTMEDYPLVENMAKFYLYDMSKDCDFILQKWNIFETPHCTSIPIKRYFEKPNRKAYLVKVNNLLAGFILLRKSGNTMYIGEFFIISKFQGKNIANQVAYRVFQTYQGEWELSVIPENIRALNFWRKTIHSFTNGAYIEEIKKVKYDKEQPRRYLFNFKNDS